MRADAAKHKKAKIDMLMAVEEASVNILSAPSLILFVIGIAEDADDIKKYAIICNQKNIQPFDHSLNRFNIDFRRIECLFNAISTY